MISVRAKKSLYRDIRSNVTLQLMGAGDLLTKDMEKAKLLNAAFALVVTLRTCL